MLKVNLGKDRLQNQLVIFCFICVFLLSFFSTLRFVHIDRTPPSWDESVHLANTYKYINLLRDGEWRTFFDSYLFYPPQLYWSQILVAGNDVTEYSVVLMNYLFILLIPLSFLLFSPLDKKKNWVVRSLVAFFLSVFTLYLYPEHVLSPDLPLGAIVFVFTVLVFWCIEQKRITFPYLVVITLFASLALQMKWVGILLLIAPLAFYWFAFLKKKGFVSTAIAFCMFCFLFLRLSSWYIINYHKLLKDIYFNGVIVGEELEKDPIFYQGMPYYVFFLIRDIFWIPMIALAIYVVLNSKKIWQKISFTEAIRNFRETKKNKLLHPYWIACSIIPFILFSLIPNKADRYILPVTLLAVVGLIILLNRLMTERVLKSFLVVLICVYSLLIIHSNRSPNASPTAWEVVESYLAKHKPDLTGYFFEYDLPTFSYGTAYFFSQKYMLNYVEINKNSFGLEEEFLKRCNLERKPQLLIVVTNTSESKERFVSFEEVCKNEDYLRRCSQFYDQTFENSDRLRMFKCPGI